MAGVHAMMIAGGGSGSGSGSGGATAKDCGDITVDALYLKPNGVTIAAIPNAACGRWHTFEGKDYYIAAGYADLVSVISVYKGLTGAGEVLANLTRDGKTKSIPLNQVVTTFVDKFSTGTVTGGLFYSANTFNQLIDSWDTSNVNDMNALFHGCSAFNQPIGSWDVSNVLLMHSLFRNAFSFNQNISSWNTSNVLNMFYMFYGCSVFNQDISNWCVFKIKSKGDTFDANTSSAWTTAKKPRWGAPCS